MLGNLNQSSGMSIFRFSAEFRFFFFLLSAFLKIIFRFFFLKVANKKKKKASLQHHHCRESSKGLPPSGEFTELRYAGARFFGFWSKFESAVSPLGTRNLTPATVRGLDEGRWGWWLGGGMVEGLEMIVTEPVSVLWPSNSSICTPPSLSPSPSLPHQFTQTRTHSLTHTRTHTHTHTHTEWIQTHTHTQTQTHTEWNFHTYLLIARICLSVSLFHTHTQKIFHAFLLTNTHACTAVSVASSEHAKNSMTRISPYFNPSPFPLAPLQPTTAQSLVAGNRHQFFLTIRVEQSHLSA